jgi:hypothetical protein
VGQSIVQKCPTACVVSEPVREASIMWCPWPIGAVASWGKNDQAIVTLIQRMRWP